MNRVVVLLASLAVMGLVFYFTFASTGTGSVESKAAIGKNAEDLKAYQSQLKDIPIE